MKLAYLFICFYFCVPSCTALPPLDTLKPIFDMALDACSAHVLAARDLTIALVAYQTKEIKNRTAFGGNDSFAEQLLHTLFHVDAGNELRATNYEPYTYFSPRTIALLQVHRSSPEELSLSLRPDPATGRLRRSPNRLKTLHTMVCQALVADPLLTKKVLLSFLYVRAAHVGELLKYLDVRATTEYGVPVKTMYTPSTWRPDDLQEYQAWAHAIRSRDAQQSNCVSTTGLDGCTLLYGALHAWQQVSLPPRLYYERVALSQKCPPVLDCVESAIRELFNRKLYSTETQTVSLDQFSSGHHTCVHPGLIAFFKRFGTARSSAHINDYQARVAWLWLLSGLANVQYRKNYQGVAYELHPSWNNLRNVLAHLMPLHTKEIQLMHMRSDTDLDVSLLLQGKSSVIPCTLHIRPEHVFFSDKNSFSLPVSPDNEQQTNAQDFVALLAEHSDELEEVDINNKLFSQLHAPAIRAHNCWPSSARFWSQPTETDVQRYAFLRRFLVHVSKSQPLFEPIKRITASIWHQGVLGQALCRIVERCSAELCTEFIREKMFSLSAEQKCNLLCALNNKHLVLRDEYKQLVLECLKEIPEFERSDVRTLADSASTDPIPFRLHVKIRLLAQLLAAGYGDKDEEFSRAIIAQKNSMSVEQVATLEKLHSFLIGMHK